MEPLSCLQGSYLHGPGTGITNLASFSAMKFSLVLVELPLTSFFSILMTSFLVGLSVRQTLPLVGESCGGRLLHVLRCKIDKVDLGNFLPGFSWLHHLVKTEDRRIGAPSIEVEFKRGCVLALERRFIFIDKGFLLRGCAGAERKRDYGNKCAN